MTRIPVPADKVRTPEQILEGQTIVAGHVWVTCYNCGGHGTYPSSCIPQGMCRFYCWADLSKADPIALDRGIAPWKSREDPTFGKRPVPVATFVKRQQAADRAEYRRQVQWELDAPKREQAAREQQAREEAEAQERARQAADEAARKAVSQYVGQPGDRVELELQVTRVASFEQRPFGRTWGSPVTRYVVTLRDMSTGNVFVWFADYRRVQGDRLKVRATVKEHKDYQGERQTTIYRVKEID